MLNDLNLLEGRVVPLSLSGGDRTIGTVATIIYYRETNILHRLRTIFRPHHFVFGQLVVYIFVVAVRTVAPPLIYQGGDEVYGAAVVRHCTVFYGWG